MPIWTLQKRAYPLFSPRKSRNDCPVVSAEYGKNSTNKSPHYLPVSTIRHFVDFNDSPQRKSARARTNDSVNISIRGVRFPQRTENESRRRERSCRLDKFSIQVSGHTHAATFDRVAVNPRARLGLAPFIVPRRALLITSELAAYRIVRGSREVGGKGEGTTTAIPYSQR